MDLGLRNYLIVTGGYWAFTLTDGALRMLVVLYFHLLGYSPLEVATLFLFYEFFGIVTNLIGGWLATRIGLNVTMQIGMALQVFALVMLMVPEGWLSIAYVMLAQALSGIAKDLNKMSAKASIKTLLPQQNNNPTLFKWIAVLTGSKNALKGIGFFLGGLLLQLFEFRGALAALSSMLFVVLLFSIILLPTGLGKLKTKAKFTKIFSNSSEINYLSAARFFLFGSRDIWFVIALPLFLYTALEWQFSEVSAYLAIWIIGYGIIQAFAPRLLKQTHHGIAPDGKTALHWVLMLAPLPAVIAIVLQLNTFTELTLLIGLFIFGAVFAVNSAVHSFLIVAWSKHDHVSLNVGFYYMANAAGRLTGTVLSGWIYQDYGFIACLYCASGLVLVATIISTRLPHTKTINHH